MAPEVAFAPSLTAAPVWRRSIAGCRIEIFGALDPMSSVIAERVEVSYPMADRLSLYGTEISWGSGRNAVSAKATGVYREAETDLC